jgi:hypothetical protein
MLALTYLHSRMMSVPLPPCPASLRAERSSRLSFLSVARQIHVEHGLAGFYRGIGLACLRSFPMNGGALFVYESIMRWLGAEKVCHCLFVDHFSTFHRLDIDRGDTSMLLSSVIRRGLLASASHDIQMSHQQATRSTFRLTLSSVLKAIAPLISRYIMYIIYV